MMEIIDFLSKVSMPILTAVTILLTYFIYKLSSENNKKDNYLRYIVDLYYRIEDDSTLFLDLLHASNSNQITSDEYRIKKLRRQIVTNSTLMLYYVRRFPGYYKERHNFKLALIDITRYPQKTELYDNLAKEFNDFCEGIKKKKDKDGSYTIRFDRQGYSEED